MSEHVSRKIAGNTVAQVISKITTVATSIFIIGLIGRYLGTAGYGEYHTAITYASIFTVFVDLGFFLIVLREISSHPEKRASYLTNAFTIKVVLGLVVFALAYAVSFFIPAYSDVLRTGIALALVSQFFMTLSQILITLLQADLEMQKSALSDVVGRVTNLVALIFVVQAGGSFLMVVGTAALGNLLLLGVNLWWVSRKIPLRLNFDFTIWKELFREAIPMGIVLVLAIIFFKIDTIMLSIMRTKEEVGLYGGAYKILEVFLTFPTIFLGSVFPVLVGRLKESPERAQALFARAFDVLAVIVAPLVAGAIFFAPAIVSLILDAEFLPAAGVLRTLVWAAGSSFLSTLMSYTLIAAGFQRRLILPYLATAAFNIALNLYLIPRYGIFGAAYATVLTETMVLIYTTVMTSRLVGLTPRFTTLIKAGVAAGSMFIVLASLGFSLWLGILIGGAVYLGILYLAKALDKELLSFLIPQWRQ